MRVLVVLGGGAEPIECENFGQLRRAMPTGFAFADAAEFGRESSTAEPAADAECLCRCDFALTAASNGLTMVGPSQPGWWLMGTPAGVLS